MTGRETILVCASSSFTAVTCTGLSVALWLGRPYDAAALFLAGIALVSIATALLAVASFLLSNVWGDL